MVAGGVGETNGFHHQPRYIAHGNAAQIVPSLLSITFAEEVVHGTHDHEPQAVPGMIC